METQNSSTPEPAAAASGQENTQPPAEGAARLFATVRSWGITRGEDRWLAGVGSGTAQRFSIDPLVTRGLMMVAILLTGGVGLVVYALAWAFLPRQSDGHIHAEGWFSRSTQNSNDNTATAIWVSVGIILAIGLLSGLLTPRPLFFLNTDGGFIRFIGVALTLALLGALAYGLVRLTQGGLGHRSAPDPAYEVAANSTYASAASSSAGSAHAGGTAGAGTGGAGGRLDRPDAASTSPKRPRVPSAGASYVGFIAGISLLLLAGLTIADRMGTLRVSIFTAWVVGSFILLGLGIVVAGLRGRTSGALGVLASIAILPVLFVAMVGSGFMWQQGVATTVAGNADVTITTAANAERGYGLVAGELTVDVRSLPLGQETIEVPVNVVAGELTVLVDPAVPTTVTYMMTAGNIRIDSGGVDIDRGGLRFEDSNIRVDSLALAADGSAEQPSIHLIIRGTAANILVKDQS